MTLSESTGRIARYRESCRRGTEWLLARQNLDGSIGPVGERLCYYRAPWALALVGERTAAAACLDWIADNMLSEQGEFEGVSPRGIFTERYGAYPLSCLLTGARLLERTDLVRLCLPRLLSWQDPDTGGFFNCREEMDDCGEQELFPACQAGMTLLAVGCVDEAFQAGEWVERLWAHQPEPRKRLFHVSRPSGGLVTEFPPEQAAWYVTEKDDPWQHHFNGGISAALLTSLYLLTDDARWLESARACQEFSMTTDDCQFRSMQVCKSGWGSGLLWVATRQPEYREWTIRMADWFVAQQADDGHWDNTPYWTPEPTDADGVEVTVEFVMHMANLLTYLGVGEIDE